ncbi:MAG: small conductance mechanosensitive channel [Bacteroidia bacterium]|jgi:small conductance mechanosensitive channel
MYDYLENLGLDVKTALLICGIVLGSLITTRIVRWFVNRSLSTASHKIKVDPIRYRFFKNAISAIIWLIALGAIILLIPRFKALAITLFAGAGILMAILGFAAQQAFANIIGGIFIVMFRPFRVGDMIKVGSMEYGIVEDITLRHTVLISFENKRIIIPNSVMSSEMITNDTIQDEKICRWIEVGISYDSDLDLAINILQDVAGKHPKTIDVRTKQQIEDGVPMVVVRVMKFGDFSVDLRAEVWTKDPFLARALHSDINHAIKKRFDAEGIEIPFPYRTIVYKKDLPAKAQIAHD